MLAKLNSFATINLKKVPNTGVNHAFLSATLIEKSVIRYTPSGTAIITLNLMHTSQVQQAGSIRTIQFNLEAIALDTITALISPLNIGELYTFEGFWAPAHYRFKKITFHILHLLIN